MKRVCVVGPRWHGAVVESCLEGFADLKVDARSVQYRPFGPKINRICIRSVLKCFAFWAVSIYTSIRLFLLIITYRPNLVFVIKGEVFTYLAIRFAKYLGKVRGMKVCVWWQDDPFVYFEQSRTWAQYDYFWIFDDHYIPGLMKLGLENVGVLPFGFNPRWAGAYDPRNRQILYEADVVFAGYASDSRVKFFEELALQGVRLKLIGSLWRKKSALLAKSAICLPDLHPQLVYEHYRSAKVGININHPQSIGSVNARTFEIAGCGAFQLTDDRPGIRLFFKVGEEVEVFKDLPELKAKLKAYIKDEEAAKRIGENARKRVLKDHSYSKRMAVVMNTLNLTAQRG